MGVGELNVVVTDAGPLIHLTEVGCFLLLRIFQAVHIPGAVWSETIGQNRVSQNDVLALGNVQHHTLSEPEVVQFVQKNGLENLHNGERECLYLCQQMSVPILLTDDLAVREAAKRLNLTPVGSLGIVVRAWRLGHTSLTDAERYLTDLYDVSSLFVTQAIVELAIKQLRKYPG